MSYSASWHATRGICAKVACNATGIVPSLSTRCSMLLLSIVCCMHALCMPHVARCMHAACYLLLVAWYISVTCCTLHVACCTLPVTCCMLHVCFILLNTACCALHLASYVVPAALLSGLPITLTFSSFDLENGYDFVTVYTAYTLVCMHAHTHVSTHMHTCIYICRHTRPYTGSYTCLCAFLHTFSKCDGSSFVTVFRP